MVGGGLSDPGFKTPDIQLNWSCGANNPQREIISTAVYSDTDPSFLTPPHPLNHQPGSHWATHSPSRQPLANSFIIQVANRRLLHHPASSIIQVATVPLIHHPCVRQQATHSSSRQPPGHSFLSHSSIIQVQPKCNSFIIQAYTRPLISNLGIHKATNTNINTFSSYWSKYGDHPFPIRNKGKKALDLRLSKYRVHLPSIDCKFIY